MSSLADVSARVSQREVVEILGAVRAAMDAMPGTRLTCLQEDAVKRLRRAREILIAAQDAIDRKLYL